MSRKWRPIEKTGKTWFLEFTETKNDPSPVTKPLTQKECKGDELSLYIGRTTGGKSLKINFKLSDNPRFKTDFKEKICFNPDKVKWPLLAIINTQDFHNSKSINFTLCVAELGKLSKWGKTKLIISFRPTIENRATFAVVVIIPLPLKKDWTLYNKSRSFICNSIINRACTTQPNFDFLILLLIEILKHPSASIRPVTNQGCNFSCGA